MDTSGKNTPFFLKDKEQMKKNMVDNRPFVSIIIPLYVICDRFFSDLKLFNKLNYTNYEIIIVCDKEVVTPQLRSEIRLLLTHQKATGPAEKRDLAIKQAKGEICAFIDDDAYPDPDWIKNAVAWFSNPEIVAVGGPGLTPPSDSFWEKMSGLILQSYFGSGGIQGRFYPVNRHFFIKEQPAYNLFIRTEVLKRVGSYGTKLYGGEDMVVCMKVKEHGKIFYTPDVVVYHHRRAFPRGHLKQISSVGLKRGYLFRNYPKTPHSIFFILPTLLSTGLLGGIILSIVYPQYFLIPFLVVFMIFWFSGALSVLKHGVGIIPSLAAGIGIIVTHMAYGLYFIRGLLIRYLER